VHREPQYLEDFMKNLSIFHARIARLVAYHTGDCFGAMAIERDLYVCLPLLADDASGWRCAPADRRRRRIERRKFGVVVGSEKCFCNGGPTSQPAAWLGVGAAGIFTR
jgi:hypothetical protein